MAAERASRPCSSSSPAQLGRDQAPWRSGWADCWAAGACQGAMRRAAQSAARSLALAASRRAAGTAEITPAAAGLALARAGEQRAVSVALQPLLLSCRVGDKHQLRQLISQPCRAMRRSHFLPSAAAAACSSCLQTPGPSLPALLAQLGRTISTPPAHLRRAPHLPTPSSASCRSRQVGCRRDCRNCMQVAGGPLTRPAAHVLKGAHAPPHLLVCLQLMWWSGSASTAAR